MKAKFTITATSLAAAAMLMAAMPAIAQTDQTGAGLNAAANVGVSVHTDPIPVPRAGIRAGVHASSTVSGNNGDRMQNGEDRGDTMISARINSLNQLLARIQGMVKLSASDKASFQTSIQTEITTLTNLKAKVDADNSTTTLKDDLQSVTKSYRVYALIEPQAQISAASDRALNIVSMVGTVVTKIQTRLSSDATLSANATIQADLSDITAKTGDASIQANAAVSETASLQPDNGNATVAASNTAALKDARTKIKTAQSDLQAAQKDIQAIVKIIIAGDKSLGVSASASTTSQ